MHNADAPALLGIYGDAAVMQYTDEAPFKNLETVFLMLCSVGNLLQKGESLEWAVVSDGCDTPIGTCGLHSFDRSLGTAEVGCLLTRPAWGNGYMREAIDLLVRYAKDILRLTHLTADVHDNNHRAQRLFESLGFCRVGPETWSIALGGLDNDQPCN